MHKPQLYRNDAAVKFFQINFDEPFLKNVLNLKDNSSRMVIISRVYIALIPVFRSEPQKKVS